jgi:hypothetical protein
MAFKGRQLRMQFLGLTHELIDGTVVGPITDVQLFDRVRRVRPLAVTTDRSCLPQLTSASN